MNGQQIGIKLADGSFYPVLGSGEHGRKKLVLTTVRDNQETVQIDLYRGEGELAGQAQYIGTLTIENIQPAPKKEPEIQAVLGVDERGNLEATASDALTGESQSLSVSLEALAGGPVDSQEFELEKEGATSLEEGEGEEFEQSLLTGETYPLSATDRRKEHLHKRRRSPLLLIAFIVLSLILIAAVTLLVLRVIDGRPIPLLPGSRIEAGPEAGGSEAAPGEQPKGESAAAEAQPAEAGAAGTAEAQPAATGAEKPGSGSGVWYEIKWGDTLWDISATFYRNPWLYPRIARRNSISNPDLIIAGTKLFIPEE